MITERNKISLKLFHSACTLNKCVFGLDGIYRDDYVLRQSAVPNDTYTPTKLVSVYKTFSAETKKNPKDAGILFSVATVNLMYLGMTVPSALETKLSWESMAVGIEQPWSNQPCRGSFGSRRHSCHLVIPAHWPH